MHTYIIYTVCRIYIFFLFSRTNLRLLFSEIIQTNWAITSTTSTTTTKKRHTELIYSLCLCLSFLSFSPFFIYGIVGSFYVRACVCVYMCALNESNSIISLPFLPPPSHPLPFNESVCPVIARPTGRRDLKEEWRFLVVFLHITTCSPSFFWHLERLSNTIVEIAPGPPLINLVRPLSAFEWKATTRQMFNFKWKSWCLGTSHRWNSHMVKPGACVFLFFRFSFLIFNFATERNER